ncbi:hypothetical protein PHYPO_G00083030 [Pangasianodon hypophthalmus]|uniref:G-protein coupled receptors family 2 profile 2 domain-containing protein n=1 Tax=Pangasianodon hypophthalmus TaxID=310915 RepID=A0A5N5LLY6_PANHP|nr:hypothetical protein PHYPO_G00083030 [Pangasianodon hypophthalmus]
MPNITTPNITPANTTTDTHAISFSLKINEEFDLALTNSYSIKYKNYTKRIGDSINHSYSSVSGYKANSATVTGFRSGSVIADFNINATSDNLNLISANQQVVASLREQGFNISDDAFSRTVKDGLYESTDQIYPENDVTLTCNTTVNDNITWTKDGKELAASDKYLINKTALVVKNTAPSDSGVYECRTRVNSMPYVIWQSLMIPDPNIQVNSSKVLTCGNLKERLQCCVHTSYSVKWVSNEVCGEPVEQNIYGCIYCDYDINANECQPSDQNLTVTCTLTKSNYFRSIRIDAVNRAFTCSDDKSNGAFGAGSVGENKTDRSENLLAIDLPQFAQNVSSATATNAAEITKSPATILTIVELLKTIAHLSQTIIVNEDIMTDFLQTLDVIGSVTRNDTSYMRHVSVVNIAVSLLIANICFIIGAAVVNQGEGPCSTATFFMHFFYLALFFWMLLSALLLLYRVLMVFSRMTRGTMMAIAFTVGYGAPLIIAVITVASTAGRKGYIQKDYNCWLNWNETKALLAFVIPALTIVAINLLVLIVVLCKMMRRGVNASTQPDEKHPLMVIAKCVGILTPLFGLTWGFGIGTMVSSNFGVHVVFAFLNSLQGFFILVFGTLLDNKVREALAGKLALTNLSSNRTRSTSAGPSSLGAFPFIQRLRKRGAHNISEGRVLTTSSPF